MAALSSGRVPRCRLYMSVQDPGCVAACVVVLISVRRSAATGSDGDGVALRPGPHAHTRGGAMAISGQAPSSACTTASWARSWARRCTIALSCEPLQLEATLIVGSDDSDRDDATELPVFGRAGVMPNTNATRSPLNRIFGKSKSKSY